MNSSNDSGLEDNDQEMQSGQDAVSTEPMTDGTHAFPLTAPVQHREVIRINTCEPHRRRAGNRQRAQAMEPAQPATVANSLEIPWSVATTSIDNARSRKWGVALAAAKRAQGIEDFQRGDLVEIEVGIGEARYGLMGRASRRSMAYFWMSDLLEAGIDLHEAYHVIITAVHRESGVPADATNDGGAQ